MRRTIKNKRITPNGPMMHIGATEQSVKAVADVILTILDKKPEPTVGVAALGALTELCKVEHVTVTNCTFTGASAAAMLYKSRNK